MKATELMAGTWVKLDFYPTICCLPEEAEWKIGRVVEIHRGGLADVEFNGTVEYGCAIEDLQPVELTNDILKKFDPHPARLNDSRREWQYIMWYKGIDGYEDEKACCVYIDECASGYYEITAINHDINARVDMTIRYVHQLQFALALVEIDKEVEV